MRHRHCVESLPKPSEEGKLEWVNSIHGLLNKGHFFREFWQVYPVKLPGSIHVIANVADYFPLPPPLPHPAKNKQTNPQDQIYRMALKKLVV